MKNNYWLQRNVLVTGATGLLGPYLIKDLIDDGAEVTALVRDDIPGSNLFSFGLDKRISIVRGNLEDYELVLRAINEYEIDSIFHLGAQTIVGTSNRSPLSTFEANIKGTWNICEAARNASLVESVVVASSDKAYGSQKVLPYDETMPLKGEHPYDVSKSCADLISQSYSKTYGLPVCITRCGNFFGGGDLNFSRIIPHTLRSIIFNKNPVIRSDGKLVREYFYIKDAAIAYRILAENIKRKNLSGHAFNFGNEKPLSVIKIVDKMIGLFAKKILVPQIKNETVNEIRKQYLSCGKAKKLLKWSHQYTLEDGLAETYDWYLNYFRDRDFNV